MSFKKRLGEERATSVVSALIVVAIVLKKHFNFNEDELSKFSHIFVDEFKVYVNDLNKRS